MARVQHQIKHSGCEASSSHGDTGAGPCNKGLACTCIALIPGLHELLRPNNSAQRLMPDMRDADVIQCCLPEL